MFSRVFLPSPREEYGLQALFRRVFLPSRRAVLASVFTMAAVFSTATNSHALPGFIAGKGGSPRHNNATQVVLLKKGESTVATIWADYEGALDSFALVLPVPGDVKLKDVRTLKRDAVDHLDEISAPRFHEFWEMDACEPGEPKQEWERDLKVKAGPDKFLGAGMPDLSNTTKIADELRLDVTPHFKNGEYKFSFVPKGKSVASVLTRKGLRMPPGVKAPLAELRKQGMKILIAEIDADKVELAGARRALLSPIRFATNSPYVLPSTLGQVNSPGFQELILYVLHPTERFEVADFSNIYPPTNVRVDDSVKERLGDFYAGVHDALLAKNPNGFLVEYAWPTDKHCGEPCPNEPIVISELLTLGADHFERKLSKSEKNPKPPPLSEDEKAVMKDADPETRKHMKQQRRELVRRRALLDRNRYTITRLHHRYSADGLNSNIRVRPAKHVIGGVGTPKGPEAEVSPEVSSAEESKLQIRFNAFHQNKKAQECDQPVPSRWGLAPRSYRGLRKTWTARDTAFKKRNRFELAKVVTSAVPALGIAATPMVVEAVVSAPTEESQSGGCSIGGGEQQPLSNRAWLVAFLLPLAWLRRRSRS